MAVEDPGEDTKSRWNPELPAAFRKVLCQIVIFGKFRVGASTLGTFFCHGDFPLWVVRMCVFWSLLWRAEVLGSLSQPAGRSGCRIFTPQKVKFAVNSDMTMFIDLLYFSAYVSPQF